MFDIQNVRDVALNAIFEQKTVQELFDEVYNITNLPIMCFDSCFNYIAHACNGKFNFSSWDDIVLHGNANEDYVQQFNYLEKQEKIFYAGKPILLDTGPCAKDPSVNCAVVVDGSPIAYCGVMIKDSTPEIAGEIDNILVKALPLIMDNQTLLSKGVIEGFDVADILTGDYVPAPAAKIIESKFPPLYYYVIISYQGHSLPIMQYSQNYIQKLLGKCISACSRDNMIYMLFYDVKTDIYVNKLVDTLSRVGRAYSYTCGFSCGFVDPAEIPLRRRQAVLAATIGRQTYPDQNAFSFRGMYSDVLTHYPIRELPDDICILPEIKRLIDADKGSGVYLTTLYHYLLNFQKPSLTAEKLGLHKNTVIYRIGKMEEIMQTDLHSTKNCSRFIMSLTAYAAKYQLDFRKAGKGD